jgi:hypothetical protein
MGPEILHFMTVRTKLLQIGLNWPGKACFANNKYMAGVILDFLAKNLNNGQKSLLRRFGGQSLCKGGISRGSLDPKVCLGASDVKDALCKYIYG